MSYEANHKIIASPYETETTALLPGFAGFKPPTSNTTYTPNQFFDVVMPNASRGCLRIVGYLIRKTLGWCDANGNPQKEQIKVSYSEMERKAGVGHTMIRAALDEALVGHYIECVQEGRAKATDDNGQAALYSLKWDASAEYVRSGDQFRGFYEGEGNRTDIPNQFFDHILPNERAAVIAVVGAVIRYSIGFQARHGARRQQAMLSYGQILKAAGISSRRAMASAIREAIAKNYIVRIDPGYFSADVAERRSATYAIRWTDGFTEALAAITPKRIPEGLWTNHSEKDTSGPSDGAEKDTKNAPKRIPADHSEKESIKIKQLNEKQKQAVFLLKEEGFNELSARRLAFEYLLEVIEKQISWVDWRQPTKSRTGLLKRAIEGDWTKPDALMAHQAKEPEEVKFETSEEKEHRLKFLGLYRDWLETEETEYKTNHPADYARFAAKRERAWTDIRAQPPSRHRSVMLSLHHEREKRLMDFQIFIGLPDFWHWDADFNNQSFNKI